MDATLLALYKKQASILQSIRLTEDEDKEICMSKIEALATVNMDIAELENNLGYLPS